MHMHTARGCPQDSTRSHVRLNVVNNLEAPISKHSPRWKKYIDGTWTDIAPPYVPPITHVIESPVFLPDGTVLRGEP